MCLDGPSGPAFGECTGETFIEMNDTPGNCADDDCDGRVDEVDSFSPAAVYDGSAIDVVYQDAGGTPFFVRVDRTGAWLAPPVALPSGNAYTMATTVAAFDPVSKSVGVAFGQGNEFVELDTAGTALQRLALSANGCGPTSMDWSGSAFVAAYSKTIRSSDPAELVVATPGASPSVVDVGWLGSGYCRSGIQVAARSSEVLGVVVQDPSSDPTSVQFATLDPTGKLLGGPYSLANFDPPLGTKNAGTAYPAIAWAGSHFVAAWRGADKSELFARIDDNGRVLDGATLPLLFGHAPRLRAEGQRVTGVAWVDHDLVFFLWDFGSPPTSHVVVHCDIPLCDNWTAQMTPLGGGEYAVLFHYSYVWPPNTEVFMVLDDGQRPLTDPVQISPE
jgi:hypothetical protein